MRYLTLDVFTSTPFGGNQLAVFPDARGIPESALLPITREFNFSEVSFCFPPAVDSHTRRVRIFTPGGELPFAGHPTIGTAAALALVEGALRQRAPGHLLSDERTPPRPAPDEHGASAGKPIAGRFLFELGVGVVPVDVRIEAPELAWAELSVAKLPELGPPVPTAVTMADILSLDVSDLVGGPLSPQAVSCGQPFLIVPVKTVDAVSRARVKIDRWEQTLRKSWAPEIFVAARNPEVGSQHWHARMFAPGINIAEDPATGSAAAAFGGWLALKDAKRDGSFAWSIDQGIEMGRPSRIDVSADKAEGAVTAVRVAGRAVLMGEGTLRDWA
ncbi:MAG TPA: PhzF family phenazine biosynthesis protein [Gemmatimonadaceae bacterium]|nr:PhzF family phenazine biosynthesis protein [Gemmatimonadaceae bacterium]